MKMQLTEITNAIGIEDVPETWAAITIANVEFDSRKVRPNSLFIPLQGQRDGHEFVDTAIKMGRLRHYGLKIMKMYLAIIQL